MSKTIKEQVAEAIAPVKAGLEDREARVAVLEDQHVRDQERIAELEAALNDARAWAAELQDALNERNAELAAAKAAAAPEPDGIDLSASIYRDALADFAIRVLSGGVAVSFHEARRP